jgi:hypothetical protein
LVKYLISESIIGDSINGESIVCESIDGGSIDGEPIVGESIVSKSLVRGIIHPPLNYHRIKRKGKQRKNNLKPTTDFQMYRNKNPK